MIKRTSIIIFFMLLFCTSLQAQLYQWQTYTNKDEITSLNYFAGAVWATTTGGLVRFTPSLDTINTYIKSDGLGSVLLNFTTYTGDSIAYIGSSDGVLSKLDLQDGSFTNYLFQGRDGANIELYNADTSAGFLWIGSSIGVIKFDRIRNGGEVKEIYRTLGNFSTELPVYDVAIFTDKIYAATPEGLAYADFANPYLLDPNEWQTKVLGVNDTLTCLQPRLFAGFLYVGGTNGLFFFRNADSINAISAGDQIRVNGMTLTNDVLLLVGSVNLKTDIYYGIVSGVLIPLNARGIPADQFTALLNPTWAFFVGTANSGIYRCPIFGDPFTRVPVPGPAGNDLIGGGVTGDGSLYAVSRRGDLAKVKNNVWTTITAPDVEKISATIGDDGSVWVGTFGQGAIQYLPDGTSRTFNGANSPLTGPNVYSAEVGVINGMYTDPSGRIWFSSYQASPMRPLVMFDPHDSLWTYFDHSDGVADSNVTCVAAGLGMAALGTQNLGVMLVRYGADPYNHNDDTLKYYSRSVRLPSATVNTMAFDRSDTLWVGTPLGLAYFDAEIEFFFVVSLPEGVSSDVRALASDSRNNLWVGTADGLAFISAGQSQKIAFTTENSELVSDEIQSLFFDNSSGKLLVFTTGGLSILDYTLGPVDSAATVYPYPNPFVVQTGVEALLQFKISQRADVRIYTVAGELVRTTDVNKGWDGRNDAGELVASGIYIYYLLGEDKSQHTGKIFVLRK
jgi:streptogramin lyase